MAVSVSCISEFMFCPMKLYLTEFLGIRSPFNHEAMAIRDAYLDFRVAAESRARKLQPGADPGEVEGLLMGDLERILNGLEGGVREKVMDTMKFHVRSAALRITGAMELMGAPGERVARRIFPPFIRDYTIHDPSLELYGRVNMEIIDGHHYPVKIKGVLPPAGGAWPSDSLELTAQALLVEREFETESLVSFIDYIPLAERRTVVTDYRRRECLFDVLDEIRKIIEDGEVPSVDVKPSRCEKCGLSDECLMEDPS